MSSTSSETRTHPVWSLILDPCHLKLIRSWSIQVRANNFSYNAARFPGVVHETGAVPYSKKCHKKSRKNWSGLVTGMDDPIIRSIFVWKHTDVLVACCIFVLVRLTLQSSACSGTRVASVRCKHPDTSQPCCNSIPWLSWELDPNGAMAYTDLDVPTAAFTQPYKEALKELGEFGASARYANEVWRFSSHWFLPIQIHPLRMCDLRSESPHSRQKSSTVHCHLRPCSTKLFASTAAPAEIHPAVFGEVQLTSSMPE